MRYFNLPRTFFCGILIVASIQPAGAQSPVSSAQNFLPPQIKNWEVTADLAREFPGDLLTIKGNELEFSKAGKLVVQYSEPWGKGQVFSLSNPANDEKILSEFGCAGFPASYISITEGTDPILNTPMLNFEVFFGAKPPSWIGHQSIANSCLEFDYAPPVN
jgi:hypothetical protein